VRETAQLRPTDGTRTLQIIKLLAICATPSTTTFAVDTGRVEIYNCSGQISLLKHARFLRRAFRQCIVLDLYEFFDWMDEQKYLHLKRDRFLDTDASSFYIHGFLIGLNGVSL